MANFSGAVLFVVGNTTLKSTDQEINDRLEMLGYTVTTKQDDDAFLDTDSNWVTGFDVACVSESISSSTLGTSGRDAAQGTVFLEGGGVDDWDLATSSADAGTQEDQDVEFRISHFLCAGLVGSGNTNESYNVTTENKEHRHVDGASSGAVEITSQVDADRHNITSWLLGATLTTGTAAERRYFNGWFREDDSPDESGGFVVNDQGWALFDMGVEWCAGNDLTTDRQVAVPASETTTTGGWTGAVTSIDDPEVTTTTGVYDSTNATGNLVVKLATVTDPANNDLHSLAVAHRRSATGGTPALTIELREGYVSEASLGTLRASMAGTIDGQTDWGGNILQLTTTEADNITDYSDLFVRIIYTANSTSEMEIANIRFLVDGGAAVAAAVYPPFPRRQNTLARM